jgi:hypothetical protein
MQPTASRNSLCSAFAFAFAFASAFASASAFLSVIPSGNLLLLLLLPFCLSFRAQRGTCFSSPNRARVLTNS